MTANSVRVGGVFFSGKGAFITHRNKMRRAWGMLFLPLWPSERVAVRAALTLLCGVPDTTSPHGGARWEQHGITYCEDGEQVRWKGAGCEEGALVMTTLWAMVQVMP